MTTTPQRFLALDVFRGMTICFMIIVNTPGSGAFIFAPLDHAEWHGFTPTDLVFPSFLFAVGNAMSFAMKKLQGHNNGYFFYKTGKRTLLIFLLGFLLYWFPFVRQVPGGGWELKPLDHTRILGVLQRIALCYFFASMIVRFFKRKTILLIAASLLAGYWILLLCFGDAGDPFSITGNAVLKLDKIILGVNHLYGRFGTPFDPEGLLSTLPSVVNVLAGYLVGIFIQQTGKTYEALTKLLLAGLAMIALAMIIDPLFPVNKKLWTSSFALLTIGLDALLIAFLIYAIDFRKSTAWTGFFEVFGKNPLFIYLLSEVIVIAFANIRVTPSVNLFKWINDNSFQYLLPGKTGSLLFAVVYMLFCWSIGKLLDKQKIYIRV